MTYRSTETLESKKVREQVYERDDWRCQNPTCKQPRAPIHAHHVIHRSQGGKTTLENMVSVCFLCHEEIHAARMSVSIEHGDDGPRFVFAETSQRDARYRNQEA